MTSLTQTTILLACLAINLSAFNEEGDDPTPQAALLEKAEGRAEKGRYSDAAGYYRQLAKKYPNTPEGRIGARRSQPSAYLGTAPLGKEHGPASNRVDVAIMGDGYQLDEMKGFDKLAKDTLSLFERQKTFREYYSYFNFHRVALVSKDNGVDGFGRKNDTALDGHTTGTIAGHVGVSGKLVGEMLDEMGEHDDLAIVYVKQGILGTGGNGYATIGGRDDKTTIHEWGHAFANLGDEYSTKTHDRGSVSNRVNVSKTDDPKRVPWAHWIDAKTPGVGVYEGASGQVRGAWKPTASGCVMESGEFFCEPCRESLVLHIYAHVDPIESCTPPPHSRTQETYIELVEFKPAEFEVIVMRPKTHNLEVSWWVIPESKASRGKSERSGKKPGQDRRSRGALPEIKEKPRTTSRNNKSGRHTFELKRQSLDPGRYLVICRAQDRTKVRGDRFPWVLEDKKDLLVSERSWLISVPTGDN